MRQVYRSVLVFIAIFVISSMTVFADTTKEYIFDEEGFSISIPDDYTVFTRDIDENDPKLEQYGMTKESLNAYLTANHVYIVAISEDGIHQLGVKITDSGELKNFDGLSDTELEEIANAFKSEFLSMGAQDFEIDTCLYNQTHFLKICSSQVIDSSPVYLLQYLTVNSGKAFFFMIQNNLEEIRPSDEVILQEVLNTVKFTNDQNEEESLSDVFVSDRMETNNSSRYGIEPPVMVPQNINMMSKSEMFFAFLMNLFVTAIIYSLPIYIYRNGIRRKPVKKGMAVIITVGYGVIAFILMMILLVLANGSAGSGGAVLLWSFINYRILTRDDEKVKKEENQRIENQEDKSKKNETEKGLLILTEKMHPNNTYACYLDEEVLVGSDPSRCNMIIDNHLEVSPLHCKFFLKQDQCYVQEIDVLNHTYVNQKIADNPVVLHRGDILSLGQLKLVVAECPEEL